jgi:ABC-type polysaccharide/polyol phosphate transport system ATPase subunit
VFEPVKNARRPDDGQIGGGPAAPAAGDGSGRKGASPAPAAVRADSVSKAFRVPHQRYSSVKERFTHPFGSDGHDVVPALRGVSFEAPRGEFLGIVGRNGSGKSTLLRCIAGIYPVDSGSVGVDGSLAPFIELGVGFNDAMSARDNVIVGAVMLGMSRRQARESMERIVAFAELEDFMEVKLKNFSSGMVVRLAFAITVEVDADVLLFDEVLAVGDWAFQQKCFDRFQRLKDEGRTILLVTHDMAQVERFCDRAMLLEHGEIVDIGEPPLIARQYNRLNVEHATQGGLGHPSGAGGSGAVEIAEAWFESATGERAGSLAQGEDCAVCVEAIVREPVDDPVFTVTLRDETHRVVFATSSRWDHGPTGSYGPGERPVVQVRFENWLSPGRYSVSCSIARGPGAMLAVAEEIAVAAVHGTRDTGGVVDLPHQLEVRSQ